MYGLTRGSLTLIGAGLAGLLIWISTQISDHHTGGYWAVYGLIAGAGLVMALSQLVGGWTKWGWPRVSSHVLLVGFLPVLIAAGWVIVAAQPETNWLQRHVSSWSGDIGIGGVVSDLAEYVAVLSFGLGLVFGFVFDTTGPEPAEVVRRRQLRGIAVTAPPAPAAGGRAAAKESRRAATEAGTPAAQQPRPTGGAPPRRRRGRRERLPRLRPRR